MASVGIKFEVSTEIKPITYEVKLSFDKPLIGPSKFDENKRSIWYGIEENNAGCNGFNASEDMHKIITALKLKKGSYFYIKKLKGDNYTFFAVSTDGQKYFTIDDVSDNENRTENVDVEMEFKETSPSDTDKLKVLWEHHRKNFLDV